MDYHASLETIDIFFLLQENSMEELLMTYTVELELAGRTRFTSDKAG